MARSGDARRGRAVAAAVVRVRVNRVNNNVYVKLTFDLKCAAKVKVVTRLLYRNSGDRARCLWVD